MDVIVAGSSKGKAEPKPNKSASAPNFEEFAEEYPYANIISDEVGYCYKRLINDSSCCLDQQFPRGVSRRAIRRPGTEWTCGKDCLDSRKGLRGEDTLWIPVGASCASPRLLWVHGGSWEYGSPTTLSYGQLAAKLAHKSGAIVMVPDYPLSPHGNFTTILKAAHEALSYLSTAPFAEDPFFLGGDCAPGSAALFLGGDSSGGGTAMSLLLTLKKLGGWSPEGIKGTDKDALPGGQLLAGGVFYSPWTNLRCDTPDYYYNAFAKIVGGNKDKKKDEANQAVYVGDVMFRGRPKENLDQFTANARTYIGANKSLLVDPVASSFYAGEHEFGGGGIPPLYFAVGGSESILGDSLIVAQKAAFYGADVHLDVNVGMWHDFPMYSEGCGSGAELWQAMRTLNRTGDFIRHISRVKQHAASLGLLWPPSSARPGTPHTSYIYDLTRGDTAKWFPKQIIAERAFESHGVPAMFAASDLAAAIPAGSQWTLPTSSATVLLLPAAWMSAGAGLVLLLQMLLHKRAHQVVARTDLLTRLL